MVASERDFAMSQMKEMAEQVQAVAGEFKSMGDHCDHILKELEQVLGYLVYEPLNIRGRGGGGNCHLFLGLPTHYITSYETHERHNFMSPLFHHL